MLEARGTGDAGSTSGTMQAGTTAANAWPGSHAPASRPWRPPVRSQRDAGTACDGSWREAHQPTDGRAELSCRCGWRSGRRASRGSGATAGSTSGTKSRRAGARPVPRRPSCQCASFPVDAPIPPWDDHPPIIAGFTVWHSRGVAFRRRVSCFVSMNEIAIFALFSGVDLATRLQPARLSDGVLEVRCRASSQLGRVIQPIASYFVAGGPFRHEEIR